MWSSHVEQITESPLPNQETVPDTVFLAPGPIEAETEAETVSGTVLVFSGMGDAWEIDPSQVVLSNRMFQFTKRFLTPFS
jgi:hypothetical protein